MNNIDARIVQMQFDNENFEKKARDSIKTMGNLKKELDVSNSAKSFSTLQRSVNNFSLDSIGRTVDNLAHKFSNLGIVGITAIQNITNSAIASAKQLVSSLTIDPISQGFDEYEIKMQAIQTIMTNTAAKGTTLNQVNAGLAELNEYADKTIYNFAQMTDNISKFTAAGVGLEGSITSIKGLANVAAGFGVDATKMAAATYQMSQAVASGSIKLIDWNSLVQAGMGGDMIQKAFKQTAKEMGILVDETIPFRETLEKGWLTSEVFIKTMDKMAKDKSLLAAATNVTTFTKLLNTMKESVASGWANTWELIFGGKDESTKLFTGLNDAFSNFVKGITDARNAALKFWNDFGGRGEVLIGLGNILISFGNILTPIQKLLGNLIPDVTGDTLVYLSKKFREFTEFLFIGEDVIGSVSKIFYKLTDSSTVVGGWIETITINVNKLIDSLSGITTPANAFETALMYIGKTLAFIRSIIQPVIDYVYTLADSIIAAIGPMDEFTNSVTKDVAGGVSVFSRILNILIIGFDKFLSVISWLGTGIKKVFDLVANLVTAGLENITFDHVLKAIMAFVSIDLLRVLKPLVSGLIGAFTGIPSSIANISGSLANLERILLSWKRSLNAFIILQVAAAVTLLAGSLYLLAGVPTKDLTASTIAVGVLFAEVAAATKILSVSLSGHTFAKMYQLGFVIIGLATATSILAGAVSKLKDLKWHELLAGLVVVDLMLSQLVLATKTLPVQAALLNAAAAILTISVSLGVLSGVVAIFGSMQLDTLGKGLGSIVILLTGLTLALKYIPLGATILKSAAAIGVFALSVAGLAGAVAIFGNLQLETLAKGLGSILITLGLLVGAANLLRTAVFGPALILAFAAAINLLVIPIIILGNLPLKVIGVALLALAGTLGVLGGLAYLLAPLAPIITALAASIALIGVGAIGVGASIALMSIGLVGLAAAAATIYLAIPLLGKALRVFAEEIQKSIPVLTKTFESIVLGLAGMIPVFEQVFRQFLDSFLTIMEEYNPKIIRLMSRLLIDATDELKKHDKEIKDSVKYIYKLIGDAIAEFLEETLTLIVSSIWDMSKVLNDALEKLYADLGKALRKQFNKLFSSDNLDTAKYGSDAANNFSKGFTNGVDKSKPIVYKSTFDMGEVSKTGLKDSLDSRSPSKEAEKIGNELGNGFVIGIDNSKRVVYKTSEQLGEEAKKGLMFGANKDVDKTGGLAGLFKGAGDFLRNIGKDALKPMTDSIDDVSKKLENDFGSSLGSNKNTDAMKNLGKNIKTEFEKSMDWIADEKYYQRMNLVQELEAYERVGARYAKNSEERKKIDKEVFRVKNEMISYELEAERQKYMQSKAWIDEEKYYKRRTLEQELDDWIRVNARYEKNSEEAKETAKEIFRVKNEIAERDLTARKDEFDKSKAWIQQETDYERDNLQTRLDSWNRIIAREEQYEKESGVISSNLKEAKLEAFRLTNEIDKKEADLIQDAIDLRRNAKEAYIALDKDYADRTKDINDKLNADIKAANDVYVDALKSRTNEIYSAFGLFDKLDEEEKRNKDILDIKVKIAEEEKKILELSKDTDIKDVTNEKLLLENQIKNLRTELYRIQQIQKGNRQGTTARIDADTQARLASVELSDMEAKLKVLKDTQVKYDDASKKRIASEKEITKLNDDLSEKQKVTGAQLSENLRDQVETIKVWTKSIEKLKARGVNSELLQELSDMGPRSLEQLEALNSLTDEELTKYANLWLDKYTLAYNNAEKELALLKVQTGEKIKGINKDANTALDKLNTDSTSKLLELNNNTAASLQTLRNTWKLELGNIESAALTSFTKVNDTIAKLMSISTKQTSGTYDVQPYVAPAKTVPQPQTKTGSYDVQPYVAPSTATKMGVDAATGYLIGLQSKTSEVKTAGTNIGKASLTSIADFLYIKSPSKKMYELGSDAALGFVNGLKNAISMVMDESIAIGSTTIASLKLISNDIADFLNDNLNTSPIITPVLDLTSIKSGLNSMSLNTSTNLARRTSPRSSSQSMLDSLLPVLESNGQNGSTISNTFEIGSVVVREEADIKRIARELYQLQVTKNRG